MASGQCWAAARFRDQCEICHMVNDCMEPEAHRARLRKVKSGMRSSSIINERVRIKQKLAASGAVERRLYAD